MVSPVGTRITAESSPLPRAPRRWARWALGVVALGTLLAGVFWFTVIRRRLPPGILDDVRAGVAARHLTDPDQRLRKYLEGRYGSMSDPANRQKAFLDFFNLDHIVALQFLVKHAPEVRRQESIDAMARWVGTYRDTLSPEETLALKSQISTAEGQAMLRRATAQYNSQDVQYRGSTAPVISQLLRTIHAVQESP